MIDNISVNGDITLYFVISSKHGDKNNCGKDMWQAYNECVNHNIQVVWIGEDNYESIQVTNKNIFVFEYFEGDAFEKLKTSKCLIVGPRCLLICFVNGEPIPQGTSPIFTTAMKGQVVCPSGLSATAKKNLKDKVEYMGGIFTKELRGSVTHLVTNSVISAKYERAVTSGIKIMTEQWVYAVWKTNLKEFVKANHEAFDKFKCPVFLNLSVTTSNFPKQKKKEIQDLIEAHQGIYMTTLDGTKTKIVIAPEDSSLSAKLKYALDINIPCLKIDWIHESINKGYALPSTEFAIKLTKKYSAPKSPQVATVPIIDKLKLTDAKLAGPFLDGCNIYLTGFSSQDKDKLNKILNIGNATRLDDLSEALTHVLVGDINRATSDLKLIKTKGLSAHVLKLEWLEESIRLKKPALEKSFRYDNNEIIKEHVEPASPLSKKNLQMLQRPKTIARSLFDSKPIFETEESDLVQQYSQISVSDLKTKIDINESCNSVSSDGFGKNEEINSDDKIFGGKVFVLNGFDDDTDIKENLTSLGGIIAPNNYKGIPDFGVVPLQGASLRFAVNEIVTNHFIEDCMEQNRLLDIMYYHQPVTLKDRSNPLSDCVVTLSTYANVERDFLFNLVEILGARCQNTFARKRNVDRNVYASTHLICPTPEGDKYNGAVRWNLPVVTSRWLMACAKRNTLVDETPYLVGESRIPEKIVQNNDVLPTPTRNTCSNQLLMNLKKNSTPQSIRDANPSPNTIKKQTSWVQNVDEFKSNEGPPRKKRALNTPLSNLKKEYWIQYQNEDDNCANENKSMEHKKESFEVPQRKDLDDTIDNSNKLKINNGEGSDVIKLQIANLANALRRNSCSSDSKSCSGESSRPYMEPDDDILKHPYEASQQDTVGWSDEPNNRLSFLQSKQIKSLKNSQDSINKTVLQVLKRKFMLSGIKDKTAFEKTIQDLNGEVSTEVNFDETATHLLCIRPSRNEKMLGSIAAGKWVLHCSYLRDSEKEKGFLDEEKYEWGNPKSKGVIPEPGGDIERAIAAAAYRWRLKLLNEPNGAFKQMVAILLVQGEKYNQFKRLIEAGSGTVVQARAPYFTSPLDQKITHCFITINKQNQTVDWAMLASRGILCFIPQYLSDYLICEKILDPRECVIPEFKKYMTLMPK